MIHQYISLAFVVLISISCTSQTNISAQSGPPRVTEFGAYWFRGLAEITSYELQQARYGELHKGTATSVFVTEPFNPKKQVKADNPTMPDNVSVLKLNQTRKFNTGIYPYSTMTSTFTPVNNSSPGNSIKLTNTVQEWCGQVFMQMNRRKSNYQIQSFSYFESESDANITVKSALLEDEIFNMIRINPEGLPTGEIEVFPSTVYLRFAHKEIKNYEAIAVLGKSNFNGKSVNVYTLNYTMLDRELNIYFNSEFPYSIEGWEDTSNGFDGNEMTTVATKKNQIRSPYWGKNSVQDTVLYQQLFDF